MRMRCAGWGRSISSTGRSTSSGPPVVEPAVRGWDHRPRGSSPTAASDVLLGRGVPPCAGGGAPPRPGPTSACRGAPSPRRLARRSVRLKEASLAAYLAAEPAVRRGPYFGVPPRWRAEPPGRGATLSRQRDLPPIRPDCGRGRNRRREAARHPPLGGPRRRGGLASLPPGAASGGEVTIDGTPQAQPTAPARIRALTANA